MKDIIDSIKLKLCETKATPFLGAYTMSWFYFNSKLILIYFDSDLSVDTKINMLSWNDINYLYPLYIACFYVVIFPFITIVLNAIKLLYKRLYNIVENMLVYGIPLTIEEANDLREKHTELELELSRRHKEIEEAKERYSKYQSDLEALHNSRIEEMDETISVKVQEAEAPLKNKVNQLTSEVQRLLDERNNYKGKCQELEKSLRVYEVELDSKSDDETSKQDEALRDLSDQEIAILKSYYDGNTNQLIRSRIEEYLNQRGITIKQPSLLRLLNKLVKKSLITPPQGGYYILTEPGLEVLHHLFDKE